MGNKKFRPHWFFILILSLTSVIFGARTVTAQVVINEVYGGGGNIGAPYSNDFVELFNPSGSAVALTLSSVQYQSPGSNTWSVVGTLALATVPANGYYLIQLGSGGANGSALPTPDLTGSATNLNSSAGKVVLVGQVAALANGCPGAYLDLVGYGTTSAPCNEGAQNAPVPGNTTSIQRVVDGFDSNENSDDFTNLTPTPRNSTLTPPAITDIADQTIAVNGTTGALNFTVGDATTPAASLTVAGVSDNQTLAPDANIVFGGAGASRTIAVTPAAGQSGSVTITVTVTDGDNLIASDTFTLFVGSPTQCLAGGEVSVTPDTPATSGGVTLHASAQTAAQASVDAQDDAWRAGASALGLSTFGTASGLTANNKSAQQTLTDGVRSYAISTREMTNGLNAPPCNGVNLSAGRNVASNNVSLQANGPRPTAAAIGNTVYSYSETLGGLNANSGARNGLLFSFDSTQAAFGAWFGDVEGRGDSTPITVRLFDANGDRIGGDFVINETNAPYGNAATRWIGFVSTSFNVKSMLVIVGDDDLISFAGKLLDAPTQGQGFSEHLGFVGGTFANSPTAAAVMLGGYALTGAGRAPRGAVVTLTDFLGQTQTTRVDRWGHYSFTDVAAGQTYFLTIAAKGFSFAPATRLVVPNFDEDELNFTASPTR